MKALRLQAPNVAAIEDVAAPVAGAGDVLVAPAWVGLCGTDLELFGGVMPYLAQGNASYPLQPGHEVAGVVQESPTPAWAADDRVVVDPVVGCGACAMCRLGRETHCADRRELGIRRGLPGGLAELIAVPTRKLHRVPDGLPLREAVLVEPAVTVVNGLRRLGRPDAGRALVIGSGTLGSIAAQLLVSRGVAVDVLVLGEAQAALVEDLGAAPVLAPRTAGYEVVVEAAGTPHAVNQALAAVAPGGRIALMGVLPSPVDQVDVNAIVLKDVTVLGILSGPGLFDETLEALRAGEFCARPLINREFELDDARAAFDELANPERGRPKLLIRVSGSD
jgi:2-desacetyl-2-hydroxyethyl bacteriochlorophyllide A dehydrogenase